jgi:3-deoxy-D-manno-octulosonate 8-phosphate phosphatase (KDO 8-P phosphatase)
MLPASDQELRRRAGRVRLVLTDCDGVLTDNGVYYSERGEELKRFSIRDGMGFERLRNAGIACAIVSGERSGSIARRAEKLLARAYLGVRDKASELRAILDDHHLAGPHEVAFIGDDVNDLAIIDRVASEGLAGAPADAMPEVRARVHFHSSASAGHGAFRDFAEWIIRLRDLPALAR